MNEIISSKYELKLLHISHVFYDTLSVLDKFCFVHFCVCVCVCVLLYMVDL